jgi:putative redox protein
MAETKPPTTAELIWSEGLRFGATAGKTALVVDGDGAAGPSPVHLAAIAVAGCMGADVVYLLEKGRQPLTGMRISFSAERAARPPQRFTRIRLNFHVAGAVTPESVERAIAMSRETYCSVWHSMRQDIEFVTAFDIRT